MYQQDFVNGVQYNSMDGIKTPGKNSSKKTLLPVSVSSYLQNKLKE